MAKKTPTNPRGAGAKKFKDRSKLRVAFWATFRKSTIKNMGGKTELRRIIVEYVEELERQKLAKTLEK